MPSRRLLPLLAYLAAQPPALPRVQLTLAELEALLGRPLPPGAHTDGRYWASGVIADNNWRSAGGEARLSRSDQTVTFTRSPP